MKQSKTVVCKHCGTKIKLKKICYWKIEREAEPKDRGGYTTVQVGFYALIITFYALIITLIIYVLICLCEAILW